MEEGVPGVSDGDPTQERRSPPGVDRLSALSDSLLLHILSFLQMRDVVSTANLSRRWRHLWTSTPCLDFSGGNGHKWRLWGDWISPDFVDRALILHEGAAVKTFCVHLSPLGGGEEYDKPEVARQVDSWLLFACRRGVEELELDYLVLLTVEPEGTRACYTPPHCVFTCESLVSLTLRFCRLAPPPRVRMTSLKILTLCTTEIEDLVLRDVVAGCPLLEHLALRDCNPVSHLRVDVERAANPRLRTLMVADIGGVSHCSSVVISAPGVTTLILEGYPKMDYHMENLSSVVTARLDFSEMMSSVAELSVYKCFPELLCRLRHVQVLKLCTWCIQVLSVRASEGSMFSSDFGIKSLELVIGFITCEFPGILYALRSFTKLENLTINVISENRRIAFKDDILKEYYVDESKNVMSDVSSSPEMLQCLKTVNILGPVIELCAVDRRRLEFIQFLLLYSPVLERLTIRASANAHELTKTYFGSLSTFASRLRAWPRASPNALVIIQDK